MRHNVLRVFLGLGLAVVLVSPVVCLDEGLEPTELPQDETVPAEITDSSVALPELVAEPVVADIEPKSPEENAEPVAPMPEVQAPEPVIEPAAQPVPESAAEPVATVPAPKPAPAPKAAPPAAAVPAAAPVSAPAPTEPIAQIEKVGIDTLSINEQGGNWLLKRIWYEKALQRYEKIKSLVDEVLDSRTAFFNKRTELDRTLFEPFFSEIGLEMGELQAILNDYMERLQELRKKEGGSLNAQELEFSNRIGAEKEELEHAQADVKSVLDVENALEDALAKLMEQINLSRNYEKQALQNFKEIAKILDDKKARDLYYEMETHLSNVKAILDYIQHPFAQHFSSLETKARELTDKIKKSVHMLKEKGIEFKSKSKELEEDVAKRNAPTDENSGIGSKIMGGLSYVAHLVTSAGQWVWNGIASGFNWVRSLFGGSETADTVHEVSAATHEVPAADNAPKQQEAPAVPVTAPVQQATEAETKPVAAPPVIPALASYGEPVED